MKALTIRNVKPPLARALQRESRRRRQSLNQTVLDVLAAALGADGKAPRSNGLRALAGTWTPQQAARFERSIEAFEQIDEELWS